MNTGRRSCIATERGLYGSNVPPGLLCQFVSALKQLASLHQLPAHGLNGWQTPHKQDGMFSNLVTYRAFGSEIHEVGQFHAGQAWNEVVGCTLGATSHVVKRFYEAISNYYGERIEPIS